MRPTLFATIAATAIGGAVLLTAGSADAQSRKRKSDDMFYMTAQQREARYRVRPRVTVYQRSYLDAGTEVQPGSMNYHGYAFPYGYSAIDTILPPGQGWNRTPFNDPYDVPGQRIFGTWPTIW
jgi:hypothetical protein